jgi:hypothetical protein
MTYALKLLSSATVQFNIEQYIETANTQMFAGKTMTLSASFAASTATSVSLQMYYSTSVDAGTAGSWVQLTASGVSTVVPTSTTYVRGSATFTVPATAKTVKVVFISATVSAGTSLYVGNVQLEEGYEASLFRRNSPNVQAELEACKRYYENYPDGILATGYVNATTIGRFILSFAEKRVAPAATASGGAGSFAISRTGTDPTFSSTAITFFVASKKHCVILATTTGLVVGQGIYLYAATSAGNIALDSEL